MGNHDMRPISDPYWGPGRFIIDRERYRSVANESPEVTKQVAQSQRAAQVERLKCDVVEVLKNKFPDEALFPVVEEVE